MADGATDRPGESGLQVGDFYRTEWMIEFEVLRRSPAVYEAREVPSGQFRTGATKEIAIAQLIIAVASMDLHNATVEFSNRPQEGTRQIVGDDVTSEQLRDTYLGGTE